MFMNDLSDFGKIPFIHLLMTLPTARDITPPSDRQAAASSISSDLDKITSWLKTLFIHMQVLGCGVASLASSAGPLMKGPLLVRAGIWVRRWQWLAYSSRRTPWDLLYPPTNDGRCDTHLTSIQGTAQPLMSHTDFKTPGWQFIAGSGFKHRLDSLKVSVRPSRSSCQPSQTLEIRVSDFNPDKCHTSTL